MKKIIIAALLLSGCATPPPQNPFDYSHVNIVASTETRENPEYTKDFNDCNWYATSDGVNPARAAAGGALAGAGIASLFGLALGVNDGFGSLAGVGALSGGLSGAAGAKVRNDTIYKQIMLECLRKRGYEVY
ncbi:MAG: hypothetical protein KIT80_23520 [Chitinophagaceae bacterium]|nr:hypothetical protein [Nitrosomonas sp.]MCW5929910.1 hypothetical protein [Chitinophagaceae bacterium]